MTTLEQVRYRVKMPRRSKNKPPCAERDREFLLSIIDESLQFISLGHRNNCSAYMGGERDCTCGSAALRAKLESRL